MRLAALFILLAFLALAGCGSGNATTASASVATTTTTATAATTTTEAAAATTTVTSGASATATTTGSATWQKVIDLTGNGNEETDSFTLSGGPCRLIYKVTGEKNVPLLAFAAYVLPEGYDLDKQGGFPDVFITESGEDTIQLTRDAGTYSLIVKAASCDYTISIEEQK